MNYEVYCLHGDCDFSATESDVQDADSARRLHADQTGHRVEIQFEGEIRADGGLPYGDVAERDRILARLEELTESGFIRMKASRIALGTDHSAVLIGQYLTNLPDEAWPTVDVEVYSRSSRATVWEVTRADEVQTDDAPNPELVTDGGSDVDDIARWAMYGGDTVKAVPNAWNLDSGTAIFEFSVLRQFVKRLRVLISGDCHTDGLVVFPITRKSVWCGCVEHTSKASPRWIKISPVGGGQDA